MSNPITTYLDEIEARLKAATPGPWRTRDKSTILSKTDFVASTFDNGPYFDTELEETNSNLIAHAPTDLQTLIAIVRRYEEALQEINRARPRFVSRKEFEESPPSKYAPDVAAEAFADVAEIIGKAGK
jgi:hypothetical protein